jgi:small GTP-binding protein
LKKKIINGKIIQVKIWDTAGQERYKGLTKNYFRNSDGVIITYDVTNNYSFEKVHDWIESIFKYNDSEKDIKLVLVGNKIDKEKRINSEEGKNLAKMYGIPFFLNLVKRKILVLMILCRKLLKM